MKPVFDCKITFQFVGNVITKYDHRKETNSKNHIFLNWNFCCKVQNSFFELQLNGKKKKVLDKSYTLNLCWLYWTVSTPLGLALIFSYALWELSLSLVSQSSALLLADVSVPLQG